MKILKSIPSILILLLLFGCGINSSEKTSSDIRKEERASTLGSRIRDNENLSREEQKYVETTMRKKNITREELADHIDKSYQRSEQKKYFNSAKNKHQVFGITKEENNLSSLIIIGAVAICLTIFALIIRFLFLSFKIRQQEKQEAETRRKDAEEREIIDN